MNLAAQVLSHSVAAGISFLVTAKELPEDAIETAKFIEHFDALFNTFNSQSLKSSQRLGHAFRMMPRHQEFLEESLKFLDSIRTLGNIELPCICGWKLCIHSLLGLWEHLKAEHDFKFIFTSRLNQDCAENLFHVIHGKGASETIQMQSSSKMPSNMLWQTNSLSRVERVIVKLIMTRYYWI